MTPYKQKFLHDPANNVTGDCYRTAIACLLDVDPESIPHVHEDNGAEASIRLARWLESQGYTLIHQWVYVKEDQTTTPEQACKIINTFTEFSNTHFVLSGQSKRDTFHAVVACGTGLVHDPHPSDDFIDGPYAGYYYVTLIGKLL